VARALVSEGTAFRRCLDVPAIRLSSVSDARTKAPTGWVEAEYGAIPSASGMLYGWIVAKHRHGEEPVVEHLR
jgi:hypothetical protein